MAQRSLLLDLDDPRSAEIAEAMANNTCKRILALLSERELSESDLAHELNIPLNTVDYNIKKLLKTGLIEKSKLFFWSVKGKKVATFRVAHKRIIISARPLIRGILPAALLSVLVAVAIKVYMQANSGSIKASAGFAENSLALDTQVPSTAVGIGVRTAEIAAGTSMALWFLVGSIFALLVVCIWYWLRRTRGKHL